MTVEAVVLTRNEEANLRDCLRCLLWADALTVLDSYSEDSTAEIAMELGARLVRRQFRDFADQREAALDLASADWVFFVDADERSTPALADEVRAVMERPENGWWVPRDNYIFGRLTRYAGWYPDYQLRLLRRGAARYDPTRPVHETVLLDGTASYLRNTLVHYNYRTLRQFLAKQRQYARLEATALADQGVRAKPHSLVLQPVREFRRRFVTLEGYRMGGHGLLLSSLLAYYALLTYGHLLRAQRRP